MHDDDDGEQKIDERLSHLRLFTAGLFHSLSRYMENILFHI